MIFRCCPKPRAPIHRSLEEGCLPICESVWEEEGLQTRQTALVTLLSGASANGPVPPSDATAVWMARFVFTNSAAVAREAPLPLGFRAGNQDHPLRADAAGLLWSGSSLSSGAR